MITGTKQRWIRLRWSGKEGWALEEPVKGGRGFFVPVAHAQAAPPGALRLEDPLVHGSFISILFGMLAKNIFDLFIKQEAILGFRILLRIFLPLVVSPIAFLAFIKTADFAIQDELGMLVLFLFAFQNGFFWQDVLAKPPAGK